MLSNTLNNTEANEFLERLMSLSYNQKCADCGRKRPSWATLTYSFFICYECSGQHRNLGAPRSRVKSTQMDQWSTDDLRRMYVGGNKNAHKVPDNSDFSLKYGDCDSFVQELNGLVEKSERNEPGDSFMSPSREQRPLLSKDTPIKKKQRPKFSDAIDDILSANADTLESSNLNKEVAKSEKPISAPTEQDSLEEDYVSLHHVSKPTNSLKKSLNTARSPFSFTPGEIEDLDK